MSTSSLENMVSTLFSAPGRAAIETELAYRKIWINWLKDVTNLIAKKKFEANENALKQALMQHLELAPVMKISGVMEIGLTMRIASLKESNGSISMGIGAIALSGSYGFASRTAEESIIQVRAQYTLTNSEVSLEKYLGTWGITLASAESVENAIKMLSDFSDTQANL